MYQPKDFNHLLGLNGFGGILLKNHFILYQGYVTNFNKLNDILVELEKNDKFGTLEFAELNRRFGWEFNGMRLHELYFGNLTKDKKEFDNESALAKKIIKEWGSYGMWEKDFKSMGAMRGIGWIILYYDAEANRLFNVWIDEHNTGHFTGCVPLLVMDVFEHAYMVDYDLKKMDYIEMFMKVIDWRTVEARIE